MKLLQEMISTMPNAADMWLFLIILLHAFGKKIPWFLWGLFVIEFLAAMNAHWLMEHLQ